MLNWEEIYNQNTPKLLGICRRYVNDVSVAEDIVQDAFIIAMQKEKTYKGTGSFEGWLTRIVINTAINYLNTKMKTTELNSDTLRTPEDTPELTTTQKSSILAADFSREELIEVIDKLPEHHKIVFNMYIFENYSHQEIAQTLNISVNTSKSSLLRARKKIQELLFEKTNLKNIDEKKKKRMVFWLFLGLGNVMLASNLKSAFSGYTLQPNKVFNPNKPLLPSSTTLLQTSVIYNQKYFTPKIIMAGVVITTIFSIIFFNTNTSLTPNPDINPIKKHEKKHTVFIKDSLPIQSKNTINYKPVLTTKVTLNEALPVNPQKDSVSLNNSDEVEIVIVRKKIITRDTVFIEK